MEVNDYVRTKRGIFQIRTDKIHKEKGKKCIGISGRGYTCLDVELIEKSSPNIIDLIEVGDYVNGGKVYEKEKEYIVINADFGGLFEFMNIYEKDIKSIVTKEQFKSMEYKVKE